MKIVVLGAGRVGYAIVEDLIKYYSDIDEIIVGDIIFDKAVKASKLDPERITPVKVDASKLDEVINVIRRCDSFINATYYGLARISIEASLKTGIPYLDLGSGLYRYHDAFLEAGVPAILDIGGAPGLINILAKYGVDSLDDVEYIHLYDVNEEVKGPNVNAPIRYKYSPETVLDEATMPAVIYRDGEFIRVPPLTGFEERQFPEPIGVKKVFYIYHNEVETLARTFRDRGLKEIWYKIDAFNLPWEEGMKWKLLAELGFAKNDPIEVDGAAVSPRKVLIKLLERIPDAWEGWEGYELLEAEVKGYRDGDEVLIRVSAIAEINWRTGSTLTAAPPAIVGYWLAKRKYNKPGAYSPEQILDSREFLAELARRDNVKILYEEKRDIILESNP